MQMCRAAPRRMPHDEPFHAPCTRPAEVVSPAYFAVSPLRKTLYIIKSPIFSRQERIYAREYRLHSPFFRIFAYSCK